jgi:putative peptidoglycan lipid II flippase
VGLLWYLQRRIESVDEGAILRAVWRAGAAALAASGVMLGGLLLIELISASVLDNALGRLVALLGLAAAGLGAFALASAALRAPELDQLVGIVRRRPST